jgi:signal transduction histidine kinase
MDFNGTAAADTLSQSRDQVGVVIHHPTSGSCDTLDNGQDRIGDLTEQLDSLRRRQHRLIGLLSRELRHPVAAIISALSVLEDPPPEYPIQADALAVAKTRAAQVGQLADDLLSISRLMTDSCVLTRARIDLRTVVKRAIEMLRPAMTDQRQELLCSFPEGPVWLDADPNRLHQVFHNLVGNATKFTPYRGCIWVQLFSDGDCAVVRVRDSGCGISADLLPRVFELFVDAESKHSGQQRGRGIGLALAKGIVELHGGTVQAHSDGPGRGADFTVRLPGLLRS